MTAARIKALVALALMVAALAVAHAWRPTAKLADSRPKVVLDAMFPKAFGQWVVDDRSRGQFRLYTVHRNDPRDWSIEDGLTEEVSQTMKMALIFLAIYHASPKQ